MIVVRLGHRWSSRRPAALSRCLRGRVVSSNRRAGYTLLELLLVLSILLVVVGLAWSSVDAVYKHQRLVRGAEQVRMQLAASRIKAIESGNLLQFQYQPGGRGYSVSPAQNLVDPSTLTGELPESIHFAASVEAVAGGYAIGADGWSLPIVFGPDGTATDATFDVIDDEGLHVRISVRGLTAAISMSSPSRGDTL